MLKWLFGKNLEDVLHETKKIKVKGIRFVIRKVNVQDYLNGSEVMALSYDTYKTGGDEAQKAPAPQEKIKKHYAQILVAGVVKPKLCFKKEDGGILVDELFIDWDMVVGVYNSILELTYGKKKLKQLTLAVKG